MTSQACNHIKVLILCQKIPIKILYFGEKNSDINIFLGTWWEALGALKLIPAGYMAGWR